MKIAIEGCCHGELNKIYEVLLLAQQREGITIDLLICCGDFQAVRNYADLNTMACPDKYKRLMDFHEYHSSKKTAPILTLFIGGNHEASNYLRELGFGGWVAPNIYYLGYCGVVQYGGVRIGGLSGIYNWRSFKLCHFEEPPYDGSTVRSAYHVRSCDQYRLQQLSGDIDIMLSHDWPCGIEKHGDTRKLLQIKKHFESDIRTNNLGSPPAMELLAHLQPTYWFSAHLHVKFPALYEHSSKNSSDQPQGKFTKFLALDKCLPRRSYLQIIDIDKKVEGPFKLCYDVEWLAILRASEKYMSYTPNEWNTPTEEIKLSAQDLAFVEHTLLRGDLTIPENFEPTAHSEGEEPMGVVNGNPQTDRLCDLLGLDNPFKHPDVKSAAVSNPDEIDLSDDEGTEEESAGSVGWVIDTGGSRGSLELPAPSQVTDPSNQIPGISHVTKPTNEITDEMSIGSADQSHDQSHDVSCDAKDIVPDPTAPPKIKRRNLALYESQLDSD